MILIVQTNWANPDHLANTGQNWHWNQVGAVRRLTAWCLLCLAHPEGALTCMWIEQHSEGGRGSHL